MLYPRNWKGNGGYSQYLRFLASANISLPQSHIRSCFCRATGSDSVNGFQSYGPIDKAIADAFARGTGPGPENRTKFSLYFGDEWRKAKWNRIVIQNISSSIIDQKEQAHISGDLSKDIIEAYVWDLSTQARNSWRAKKPRPLETGKRWETGAEALARAKDYEARREKDLRSNSRKRNVSITHMHINAFSCYIS